MMLWVFGYIETVENMIYKCIQHNVSLMPDTTRASYQRLLFSHNMKQETLAMCKWLCDGATTTISIGDEKLLHIILDQLAPIMNKIQIYVKFVTSLPS